MSILTMLQDVAREIAIRAPSTVVNSTDEQTQRLLAHAHRTGKDIRQSWEFAQLAKRHTITLADSQEFYALPADFERHIYRTHWDATNHWEQIGPYTAQEWEWRKNGVVQNTPREIFRVFGNADNKYAVFPTPGAGEAGNELLFEYISTNWILPVQWTTATTFAAEAYCSNNGNIYQTTAGGTTGATPPTHTSGTVSDGGVLWTFRDIKYDKFLADSDLYHRRIYCRTWYPMALAKNAGVCL